MYTEKDFLWCRRCDLLRNPVRWEGICIIILYRDYFNWPGQYSFMWASRLLKVPQHEISGGGFLDNSQYLDQLRQFEMLEISCLTYAYSYYTYARMLNIRNSRMRSSLVVRASDCQCTSCNGPGFYPSIRRHSGIWGAADEAVLNIVQIFAIVQFWCWASVYIYCA
jgi:hypothetical protein